MKIHLEHMGLLEDESQYLGSLIRNISGVKLPSNSIYDLCASFYGWSNYRQFSFAHQHDSNATKNKALSSSNPSIGCLLFSTNPKLNNLDAEQKNSLNVRKHRLLNDFLKRRGFDPKSINSINKIYFESAHNLEKLKHGQLLTPLSIPSNEWLQQTVIFGDNKDNLSLFYRSIPLANAYQNGGLFIIRESLALDMINDIKSTMSEYPKTKLKVVYADSNGYQHSPYENSYSLDPLKTERSRIQLKFIAKHASMNDELAWGRRLSAHIDALSKAIESVYGKDKTLSIDEIKYFLSLENLINFIRKHDGVNNDEFSPLMDSILLIPGFRKEFFSAIESGVTIRSLCERAVEQHDFLVENALDAITSLKYLSSSIQKKPLRIEESLNGDDIVLVVMPDQGCSPLFKRSVSSMINVAFFPEKTSVISGSKTILLDNCEYYIADASTIPFAFARAFGIAIYSNIGVDINFSGGENKSIGYALANANNLVLVDHKLLDEKISFAQIHKDKIRKESKKLSKKDNGTICILQYQKEPKFLVVNK